LWYTGHVAISTLEDGNVVWKSNRSSMIFRAETADISYKLAYEANSRHLVKTQVFTLFEDALFHCRFCVLIIHKPSALGAQTTSHKSGEITTGIDHGRSA
jgi:hypothetical protein